MNAQPLIPVPSEGRPEPADDERPGATPPTATAPRAPTRQDDDDAIVEYESWLRQLR
mgnify:CR=1 FL=1